jgi:hypothetical protein
MNNFLENGAVLPSGLIGIDNEALLGAFKKTYQNVALRVGIVFAYYGVNDENNINKLVPEYDVFVFEQNEDKGSTPITYKHCIAATGFGSKADFFEAKLRQFTKKTTRDAIPTPSGQDGAIVLLLCLNGLTDTGIIVTALLHPDRVTTLQSDEPHLEGEYNGVHILINGDGSCTFTFKGATDSYGNVINTAQGNTVATIGNDGSFQVNHSTITFRLDRSGTATLTAQADVNVNCQNATVIAKENVTVDGQTILLGANAAEAVIKGNTFKDIYDSHTHSNGNMGSPTGPPLTPLADSALSAKVDTE